MTSANELLVDDTFYKTFAYSTDCLCPFSPGSIVPTAASTIAASAKPSGILGYQVPPASSTGTQFLAPIHTTDFPLN